MAHRWHFFRAGGVDQVSLRSGADLLALDQLDQKLWVALAMPTRDLELDPKTLDLLDLDKDGRIRVPDLLTAVRWVGEIWKDPDDLMAGGDTVKLSAIKDGPMLTAVRRVLKDLGKPDAKQITLADDVAQAFVDTTFNGDGVITPESARGDDATRLAILDVMAVSGSVVDRCAKQGVNTEKVDKAFEEIDKLAAWLRDGDDPAKLPLGDHTAAAADALAAVQAKLEDQLARNRVAAFDGRATGALDGQEADFARLGAVVLTTGSDEIARLPLAKVEPGRPVPIAGALNPAWVDKIATFRATAVEPLLGSKTALAADELALVIGKLAPFRAWRDAEPASPAKALGLPRVREIADSDARTNLRKLIAEDEELADEYAHLVAVEKLVRFQRDLWTIARNFVNFAEFYSGEWSAFQVGTLYLDARSSRLCVPVHDAGKHALLAGMSQAYLVYCELTRGAEKKVIAAAFTNGDGDHLTVGRNGVFYDRHGLDWDATITKIVANPISIREAFWAPYKKLARMIEETIAKRAAAADEASQARLATTATTVANADKAAVPGTPAAVPAPPPVVIAAPAAKRIDVGTVAAIGVAIGGIGAVIVGVLTAILGLGMWMPIGIFAVLLLISGPSMLLAWLKLHQRNLGPILDANGWAINGRARINVAFGAALTDLATLPPGSKRSLDDPYADKHRPWKVYLTLIVILLLGGSWYVGRLDKYLPVPAKSTSVLGKHAPANQKPVTPPTTPAPAPTPAPEAAKPAPP